jgi:hypothetical protein
MASDIRCRVGRNPASRSIASTSLELRGVPSGAAIIAVVAAMPDIIF